MFLTKTRTSLQEFSTVENDIKRDSPTWTPECERDTFVLVIDQRVMITKSANNSFNICIYLHVCMFYMCLM